MGNCWVFACLSMLLLLSLECQARKKTITVDRNYDCPYKWEELDDDDELYIKWNGDAIDDCRVRFEVEGSYAKDWRICIRAVTFSPPSNCLTTLSYYKGISSYAPEHTFTCINSYIADVCFEDRHAAVEFDTTGSFYSNGKIELKVTVDDLGTNDFIPSAKNLLLGVGAIVGIVISVIVCCIICCAIVVCCCIKSRRTQGTVYRQPPPGNATATTVTYNNPQGQPAGYPPAQPYPVGMSPPQPTAYAYGQPADPGVNSFGVQPTAPPPDAYQVKQFSDAPPPYPGQ